VTLPEAVAILCAGVAAGTVNTIVGSGSLITFPTLLAFGYSPLIANVSNTVGLVPGSVSGAIGYRRELVGQRPRAIRLGIAAGAGGLTGALLLRVFPAAFATIVPTLIGVSLILVATGPRLSRALQKHRNLEGHRSWPLALAFYATAVYGGYFGAAMGIIMISLLAIFTADDIQSLNALKNVLVALVNGVAGASEFASLWGRHAGGGERRRRRAARAMAASCHSRATATGSTNPSLRASPAR
jgi:hypothetical protein